MTIEEQPVRVLAEPYLTAFLAMHATHDLANVQLVRLVELVFVIRADSERGALDWKAVTDLFTGTDTGRFAYPAMALAEDLAPGTVEPGWLEREALAATGRMHRVLETVRQANLGPLSYRGLDVKLARARGLKELVANVSEVLLPSDDGMPVGVMRLQAQRLAALARRSSRRGGLLRGHPGADAPPGRRADSDAVGPNPGAATGLPPAVRAFDEAAARFDERFGSWLSVAAQRAAVRRQLLLTFRRGARLLELGAGTAEDALFMLRNGYDVTVTDGSPTMVARAAEKLKAEGYLDSSAPQQLVLERIAAYAEQHFRKGYPPFDGVYSNFAAFNCLKNPGGVAPALARLVRPGGACVLVVFGRCSVGEVVVELARGRLGEALRRRRDGPVAARIGGEQFTVWYPSAKTLARSLAPWFRPSRRRGIGILVPPSAAEPWISSRPRLLSLLARGDRLLTAPVWFLGDHVLLTFTRSSTPSPSSPE